jgi:hypothetical protein
MGRIIIGFPDGTSKIDGQISPKPDTADRFVQRSVTHINGKRIYFGELARFAWPEKTENHLAYLTRVDPRTCRRWLSGQNEPPAEALGVVLAEIMKRFHQRD